MTNDSISLRYRLAYIVLISLVCAIGFRGLPGQPWSYDDFEHITKAQTAQDNFSHIFSADSKEPTRWVLHTYFYLAYKVLGEEPSGYHTFNIVFHIVNSLLCARLILALFRDRALAALSGFLFAINCTAYEAIYQISAAGILLGTAFALLSVLLLIAYLASERWRYAFGTAIAYAASILSYETLASVLVPLLFLWWKHREKWRHSDILLPALLLTVAGCFVLVDVAVYHTTSSKVTFNAIELGSHIPYNLAFFTGRLLTNSQFTPFGWSGPFPFDVPHIRYDWYASGGCLFLMVLFYLSRKLASVRFLTIWITATILPYTMGTNLHYFPRYWYLPAVGGSALFAQFILWAYSRAFFGTRVRISGLAIILILFATFSFHKMKIYEGRFLVHAAHFYRDHRKDYEAAITYYNRARSEYHIDQAILIFNLGSAYSIVNRLEEAEEMFRETIRISPNYVPAYINLGYVLYHQGRFEEAIQVYRTTLALEPDNTLAKARLQALLQQEASE